MRYRILCVGRKARDPLLDVVDDYLTRLRRYNSSELVRIKDATQQRETKSLCAALGPGDHIVAMHERGEMLTTMQLVQKIQTWQHSGISQISFLIGGAEGLHPDILGRAHTQLALSAMTLPHRVALMLLLEQLYRCHTILKGEPYHKA